MASSMARDGRRRRVLNDEVRSASGVNLAPFHTAGGDPDAPRYGEQAGVEHHPQVTDFVPRRKRTMLVTLLAGLSTAAAAQALIYFAEPIAAAVPGTTVALVDKLAHGVTAWTSAIALVTIALLAKLMFSLRRHRVDDYQGRYRVWRWVVWSALLASINSVVSAHELLAHAAIGVTGYSLTSAGNEWWLAPLTLVCGWIFIRLLLEVSESRSSLALMLTASVCYSTAAAGALGFAPAAFGPWGAAAIGAATLAGHTMLLVGMMVFGRYVVLDVQGLIDHSPRPASPKTARKPAEQAPPLKLATSTAPEIKTAQPAVHAAPSYDRPTAAAEDDDHDVRRLSKAEKKRLRKQNRAA
jgi:hypothetical protein